MSAEIVVIGSGFAARQLIKNLRYQDKMDFSRAGKSVTVVDRSSSLLSALLPPEIAARLQNRLMHSGVEFIFRSELTELVRYQDALQALFSNGLKRNFDAVVCAIGLRPDLTLARGAGIEVRQGVVVDETLATSAPDVYALGDCAEIAGKLLPYLQPAMLAAMTLARNLTGNPAKLTLPARLIKVKTPDMPLHLAGDPANACYRWEMAGIIAKGFDENDLLRAFVVSEDHRKLAFSMLKEIKLTGTNLL